MDWIELKERGGLVRNDVQVSQLTPPNTGDSVFSLREETLKRMGFVWGVGGEINYINFWVYLV